jgi:hypothetical protein
MPTPNRIERKIVRFGVKYGNFVLVYKRIIEKLKPVKQIEAEIEKSKQPKGGDIDIYV